VRSALPLAIAFLTIIRFALPSLALAVEPAIRVAVIVGPVGEELTPVYIALGEAAAMAAEQRGAVVARAYSPEATPENVLAAVEGANIVVYLGHGVGTPNPYSATPDPAMVNGWGLQGPNAIGTHADSWADGSLAYYGEAWIAANARPAPGWVMIYSNACYAPGASEGFDTPATPEQAAARVEAYSRAPLTELGASAYFATDFYEGAAQIISTLIDDPARSYGQTFAADPLFLADGLTRTAHSMMPDAEVWLHRSPYFEGKVDYWYAFAGNPEATFGGSLVAGSVDGLGAVVPGGPAFATSAGVVRGIASSYPQSPGWEGMPTVALPLELGGGIPTAEPQQVMVCGDRCLILPVVDSCPCYVGTPDQRVANLSHAAWELVTDAPLEEGLIPVEVHLTPPELQAVTTPGL
jgi:hypothetical protein